MLLVTSIVFSVCAGFENTVLREVHGHKVGEVTGRRRKLHNE
jgi:hypothetical protein